MSRPSSQSIPGDDGPLPIIQYWHAEIVPDYIDDLLRSFRERNSNLRHLVFNESTAEQLIEEHFDLRKVDAFRACAVPAMQADYFRYCAVLALGGVYCDADEHCVADLQSLIPPAGGGQLFIRPEGVIINGFFAFGSAGNAFLRIALEIASANIEGRRFNRVYPTTGPPIFTYLYWLDRLGSAEAIFERASGTPFEHFCRSYCEVFDDRAQVNRALEQVSVSPTSERKDFICRPDPSLPYKSSDSHWPNWTEIYRNTEFRGDEAKQPP